MSQQAACPFVFHKASTVNPSVDQWDYESSRRNWEMLTPRPGLKKKMTWFPRSKTSCNLKNLLEKENYSWHDFLTMPQCDPQLFNHRLYFAAVSHLSPVVSSSDIFISNRCTVSMRTYCYFDSTGFLKTNTNVSVPLHRMMTVPAMRERIKKIRVYFFLYVFPLFQRGICSYSRVTGSLLQHWKNRGVVFSGGAYRKVLMGNIDWTGVHFSSDCT
jgi:hypothetical protein